MGRAAITFENSWMQQLNVQNCIVGLTSCSWRSFSLAAVEAWVTKSSMPEWFNPSYEPYGKETFVRDCSLG